VHAQTEERHRIERNIHDGVQQEIIASIAKIRLARNQLARDPELAATTLTGLQEDTLRMLENLRELSRGIHPPVLTHRGLVEALRTQASLLPIDVHVEVAPELRHTRFPEVVEEAAYFVVSEGLANVLKHASTDRATVRLDLDDGRLTVQVADGGAGCRGASAGTGIVGLQDRLSSLGGDLQLNDQPGGGTILSAVLPTGVGDRNG
jgi:signal transduction histidine kinase